MAVEGLTRIGLENIGTGNWCSGNTLALQAGIIGSIPIFSTKGGSSSGEDPSLTN
jgi:hypothetical protein